MKSNRCIREIYFLMIILLSLMLISSCAIDSTKHRSKNIFDRGNDVNVSSDAQDDFDKALALLKSSEYDQAIALLEKIIEKEKRLPAPYVNLGIAYGRKNKPDKAESILIKAVELEKTHPVANNELGLIFRKSGRFGEAKSAYENALSGHPDYLPAIRNLGILCEIYMRDLECALTQFEKYQEYRPDDKAIGIWVSDLKRRLSK